ncbi:hypothetical protein SAMD00023353_4100490 [Rosellinia necatrix]|uniref:Uncharacterized protein n=1 Tax=Rosellinia necatrix TaxID=77044 RepID=A0A1W2TNB5_ROSNE|nr:hypothetical protein SAMD00023353_4100490 [Rosellinia necatrix]
MADSAKEDNTKAEALALQIPEMPVQTEEVYKEERRANGALRPSAHASFGAQIRSYQWWSQRHNSLEEEYFKEAFGYGAPGERTWDAHFKWILGGHIPLEDLRHLAALAAHLAFLALQ